MFARTKKTISQIHSEFSNMGARASMNVAPAPRYVRFFSHHILILLRSAITPRDGLTIATRSAAAVTEKDHMASPVISMEPIVVVRPLAFRKRYANHAGSMATVTLVSNADFPQSKSAYPLTACGSDARSSSTVSDMSITQRGAAHSISVVTDTRCYCAH